MKKCTRLLALLLTFVMVFALAASSAEAAPKTYSLKIAHVNSQTHPAHIALEKFKEIVEEKTDGAVKVDIYDSSVLGGELEEIQQVIDGSLTAAMIMGMSNWQNMVPETAIEELPFMYPDVEHARAAFDGAYGDFVKENWTVLYVIDVCAYLVHSICRLYGNNVIHLWLTETTIYEVDSFVRTITEEYTFHRNVLEL